MDDLAAYRAHHEQAETAAATRADHYQIGVMRRIDEFLGRKAVHHVHIYRGWPGPRIAVLTHRLPGADESSPGLPGVCPKDLASGPGTGVMQGRLTRKCAASPGIPARRACGCYLVSSFVAAGPSLARSSGLVTSSTFSANFRWEASSCSVKS